MSERRKPSVRQETAEGDMPEENSGSKPDSSGLGPFDQQSPLDPQIVAALYADHGEELRRFLQGILRDAQLASDVLQMVFVKMAQRGHETREESRKAWLFRVAYHEAMAVRRREGVGDKVLRQVAWNASAWQASPAANTNSSAEEPLLRLESVEAVREALDELPPEQRRVVRMRIYEEKTFAAIAKELKIPLGTALARMRAAMIKLKAKLGD
jgi:RNA polymerase sigma-70 factor, ECF subfamily